MRTFVRIRRWFDHYDPEGPLRSSAMTRLVRKPATLLSLVLLLAIVPLVWKYAAPTAASAALATSPILTDDLDTALIRAGLDPQALAAVGVSSNAISGLISSFRTAMEAEPTRLSTADTQYDTARVESDRLRRLIESGRGSTQDVSSYQTQVQALSTATAGRASALAAFSAAAMQNLSANQIAMLGRIKANRVRELPVEFLVIDRSDAEWVSLRDALANERIAAKHGEEPDAAQQAALATWRSNASVSSAKVSLDTNGAAVKAAWTAAVAP
jgi:hypothetical protein